MEEEEEGTTKRGTSDRLYNKSMWLLSSIELLYRTDGCTSEYGRADLGGCCTWLARLKFCSASVPASHGHYVNEVGCFRRKFVEDFYIIMFCKPSVGRIKTASNSGVFLRKSENVLGLGTL
ncbi:hypothetical protein HZH66_002415 [Vespula vulgaris]|uniref:Uncharacterized protein n=1 Tax=Vespula vulgaris TaxID=7454 RepID=A0A834KJK2_VESVU|nr:hypothetical protein HZH66_002415 [Vespula vulgaris]